MSIASPSPSLAESLAAFGGQRALIIDDGRSGYIELIAPQYSEVQLVQAFPAAVANRALERLGNVTRAAWPGAALPFADATFDAVFLIHALGRLADRASLIT